MAVFTRPSEYGFHPHPHSPVPSARDNQWLLRSSMGLCVCHLSTLLASLFGSSEDISGPFKLKCRNSRSCTQMVPLYNGRYRKRTYHLQILRIRHFYWLAVHKMGNTLLSIQSYIIYPNFCIIIKISSCRSVGVGYAVICKVHVNTILMMIFLPKLLEKLLRC